MTDATTADQLIQRFIRNIPRFQRAAKDVVDTITEILAAGSIHATLTTRVKDLDSFRGKLELKGDYSDPWRQITDKVGVRAIVHRASHVDDIHKLIVEDGRLEVYDLTDKRGILHENELGYSGLHLDLYAPQEADDAERLPVELQIRTIAQHAWSEVSHKLLYKPQTDLDPDDRRAIWRLVALVEVFDGEVARVMDKLPARDAIEATNSLFVIDLPDILAAQYARFEGNTGQLELTRLISVALANALPADEIKAYPTTLNSWVTVQHEWLRELYNDHGPRSAMASVADYVLWSQPESISILEHLAQRPWALLAAWRAEGLPDRWLKPFEAVGTDEDLGLS